MDPVAAGSPGVGPTAGSSAQAAVRQIRKVASEFEAIFINEMLKSMKASLPKGGVFPSGAGQSLYEESMNEEFARSLAQGRGLGLADVLTRELSRQAGLTKPSSPGPTTPIGQGERSQGSDGGIQ